jgi:hypothetical protein
MKVPALQTQHTWFPAAVISKQQQGRFPRHKRKKRTH